MVAGTAAQAFTETLGVLLPAMLVLTVVGLPFLLVVMAIAYACATSICRHPLRWAAAITLAVAAAASLIGAIFGELRAGLFAAMWASVCAGAASALFVVWQRFSLKPDSSSS